MMKNKQPEAGNPSSPNGYDVTGRSADLSGQYSLVRFQAGVLARELNKLALGTVLIDRPLILEHQLALNNFLKELKVLQKYLLEAKHAG